MNILKFGRGGFFGILIPGAFLILSVLYLFPKDVDAFLLNHGIRSAEIGSGAAQHEWLLNNSILIPCIIVLSYILGFGLRLIKPNIIELLSSILWTILIPLNLIINSIGKLFRLKPKQVFAKFKFKYFWELFPYTEWFKDYYLEHSPNYLKDFYVKFLKDEFGNMSDKMKGQSFINHCKTYILEKAKCDYDEILFAEGLVRFVSGISLACIIVITLLLVSQMIDIILLIYSIILAIFLLKLRHTRFREVTTVLNLFAIIKMKNIYTKRENLYRRRFK